MTYVVLVGASGSGKSLIGEELFTRLGWVFFSKDHIKEALADSLGLGDEAWSRRLGAAAMEILYRTAATATDAVLDSNFQGQLDTQRLEALPGRKLQVFCRADPEVIHDRVMGRVGTGARHPIHRDVINPGLAAAISHGSDAIVPVPLDCPTFRLDTTRGFDVEVLLAWLREHVEGPTAR